MSKLKFVELTSGTVIERKKDGVKFLVEDVMEDIKKALVMDTTSHEEKELSASTLERFYLVSEETIEEASKQEEAPAKTEEIELTELESQLMLDIQKDNFYEEGVDSVIWTDVFLDETSSIESKKARGVLSSLVKKGLIEMGSETIAYSDLGIEQLQFIKVEEKKEARGPKVRRPARKAARPKAASEKVEAKEEPTVIDVSDTVEEDIPSEKAKEVEAIEETSSNKPTTLKSDTILALSNKLQEGIANNFTDAVRVVTETYIGYRRKYVFAEVFEMKRTLYINMRTGSMTPTQLEKLTKHYPKSYGWALDGKFVIRSEEDVETALELIGSSYHAVSLK